MAEDEKEIRKRYKKKVAEIAKGPIKPDIFSPKIRTGPGMQPKYSKDITMPEAPSPKYGHERKPLTKKQITFAGPPPRHGITGTLEMPKEASPVKVEDRTKPSKFFTAMEGVKRSAAEAPVAIQRSPLFNRARENIQRRNEGPSFPDTFGSMYIKDPVTGKNIPREGYYGEGGTFIEGPRIKPEDLRYMLSQSGAETPREREIVLGEYSKKVGVLDPETGRIGSELARRGEQTLAHIRGRYAENVARMGGKYGVDEARILSEGRDRTTKPIAQFAHRPTEEGSTIYSKFTGRDVGDETELPEHVLKNARALKQKSQKEFNEWAAQQDAATRQRLKALGF